MSLQKANLVKKADEDQKEVDTVPHTEADFHAEDEQGVQGSNASTGPLQQLSNQEGEGEGPREQEGGKPSTLRREAPL